MKEAVKQLLLALVALVGVTGCYPAPRTEQPKLKVRVLGAPA